MSTSVLIILKSLSRQYRQKKILFNYSGNYHSAAVLTPGYIPVKLTPQGPEQKQRSNTMSGCSCLENYVNYDAFSIGFVLLPH